MIGSNGWERRELKQGDWVVDRSRKKNWSREEWAGWAESRRHETDDSAEWTGSGHTDSQTRESQSQGPIKP